MPVRIFFFFFNLGMSKDIQKLSKMLLGRINCVLKKTEGTHIFQEEGLCLFD